MFGLLVTWPTDSNVYECFLSVFTVSTRKRLNGNVSNLFTFAMGTLVLCLFSVLSSNDLLLLLSSRYIYLRFLPIELSPI